jgi:glycosyltransferase involved in cell wall biosynthesis
MNAPLLTIGIPTYNRAVILEQLLDNIAPAAQALGVEVLVSNNGSTDNTAKLLDGYKSVRKVSGRQGLGFDGNVMNLFENAQGKFLWLLGDDDNFDVRQLKNILALLQSHRDHGLVYLEHEYYEGGVAQDEGVAEKIDHYEMGSQEYADRLLHKATLLSTNIVNMGYYKEIAVNPKCIDLGWIHVHILIKMLEYLAAHERNNLYVKNKVVKQRTGNSEHTLDEFNTVFVDAFLSTLKQSGTKEISLERFKANFFRLNVRRRFMRIGKALPISKWGGYLRYISTNYKLGWIDRLLFYPVNLAVLIIGKGPR